MIKLFHPVRFSGQLTTQTELKTAPTNAYADSIDAYSLPSYSANDYLHLLKQAGYTSPSHLVEHTLQEGLTVGKGNHAEVFHIAGLPQFMLRCPHYNRQSSNLIEVLTDRFPSRNFGQEVARIGNCLLVKYQPGTPIGISYRTSLQSTHDSSTIERYKSHLRNIAQFPQESYDRFAANLKYLDNLGYSADLVDPNNVLVDSEKQQLRLVDIPQKEQKLYACENNVAWMSAALFLSRLIYSDEYTSSNPHGLLHDTEDKHNRAEILTKLIKAAAKAELPLYSVIKDQYDAGHDIAFIFECCGMENKLSAIKSIFAKLPTSDHNAKTLYQQELDQLLQTPPH